MAGKEINIAHSIEKESADAEAEISSRVYPMRPRKLGHPNGDDPQMCENIGHEFDELGAVYLDGVLVTYCSRCASRLLVSPFPGSFTAKKVRGLVAMALAETEPGRRAIELQEAVKQLRDELLEIEDVIHLGEEAIDVIKGRM